MRVFISYRRDDSMVTAALLCRELTSRPEFADAFMDIDDIGYGDDFVAAIDAALQQADVVLVVIGPKWAEMLQARLRGDDWVRHEVATALRLREPAARPGRKALRVVPVLIGRATPPAEGTLPVDLAPLARIGMLNFDERTLKASINTLLESLQEEGFEGQVRRLQEERRKLEEERRLLEGERKRRTRARIASVAAGFALFLAAWLGVFDLLGLDTHIKSATMLMARIGASEPPWSGEVVLVAIDSASERAVKRRFDPSWRAEHAAVIANAASAAARAVAFDMVLEDAGDANANAALASALAATRDKMPVVFGVQNPGQAGEAGAMLAPFATLARRGVACAGLGYGQAYAMPLAITRAHAAEGEADTDASASAAVDASASPAANASAPGDAAQRFAALQPSFALAAYSGGGRVVVIDEATQRVVVRVRPGRNTKTIRFFKSETLDDPQPSCEVLGKNDRVVSQLLDPYALPPLRTAPQRISYERVLSGDPEALALLRNRVVVVGTMLPGMDRVPMPWPADDRWGVELHAIQVDGIARGQAIRPIHPLLEWALLSALALLGATLAHRLRDRSRLLRWGVLGAISLAWVVASVVWYRSEGQLIGVPYGIAALALGAWLANRNWQWSNS